MRDFLDFLEAEIPGLMTRWAAHRAAKQAATPADGPDTPHSGGTT
jgi:hypothetical protein